MTEGMYEKGKEQLQTIATELDSATNLRMVMDVVRKAARDLTGADGATFIIRDDNFCFYAEEYAISTLWKGYRFHMSHCISGWAMLNKQHVVIEDIYADHRIPHDAYRPTFVKSLAMVPIKTADPIGAIGNYWANPHLPTTDEVAILHGLADITAIAMERVLPLRIGEEE